MDSAKASPVSCSEGIGVSDFSKNGYYKITRKNRIKLYFCNSKFRQRIDLYSLTAFDGRVILSHFLLKGIYAWQLEVIDIPQTYFAGDELKNGICVANIDNGVANRDGLVFTNWVDPEMPNNQLWPVCRHEFFPSKLKLSFIGLPQSFGGSPEGKRKDRNRINSMGF
jgi:hypothetical protein